MKIDDDRDKDRDNDQSIPASPSNHPSPAERYESGF